MEIQLQKYVHFILAVTGVEICGPEKGHFHDGVKLILMLN